jgi:hypothetical protein
VAANPGTEEPGSRENNRTDRRQLPHCRRFRSCCSKNGPVHLERFLQIRLLKPILKCTREQAARVQCMPSEKSLSKPTLGFEAAYDPMFGEIPHSTRTKLYEVARRRSRGLPLRRSWPLRECLNRQRASERQTGSARMAQRSGWEARCVSPGGREVQRKVAYPFLI